MSLKPLYDNVLVKKVEQAKETPGGILIPTSVQEAHTESVVLAVGSGKVLADGTNLNLQVKVGDKVLVQKYAGLELKMDGEDVLMLKESDILAVVE